MHLFTDLASACRRRGVLALVCLGGLALAATQSFAAIPLPDRYPQPQRYKDRINLFVVQDKEIAFPEHAIVFTGSSTITFWNAGLPDDFPQSDVLGRGFGGSTINDAIHFADKTVLPHKPRQVVFYAGENDITAGRTPEGVLEDFQTFVTNVQKALPGTQILYLGMKPSPRRWKLQPKFDKANALIRDYCASRLNLAFLDVKSVLIGKDGKPRAELYRKDKLHLNADGYKLLQQLVQPYLITNPKKVAEKTFEKNVKAAAKKDKKKTRSKKKTDKKDKTDDSMMM